MPLSLATREATTVADRMLTDGQACVNGACVIPVACTATTCKGCCGAAGGLGVNDGRRGKESREGCGLRCEKRDHRAIFGRFVSPAVSRLASS